MCCIHINTLNYETSVDDGFFLLVSTGMCVCESGGGSENAEIDCRNYMEP